jgi:hypothetical protein
MNENSIFNNLHHILVLLYVDDMLVTGSRLHYTTVSGQLQDDWSLYHEVHHCSNWSAICCTVTKALPKSR